MVVNTSLEFKDTPIFVFNGMISFSFHFPQYLINPIFGAVLKDVVRVSLFFNYVNIKLLLISIIYMDYTQFVYFIIVFTI